MIVNEKGKIDTVSIDLILNDICNFVTKQCGANILFCVIPMIDDLDAKTDLQKLSQKMCTNIAFKTMQYDFYYEKKVANFECEMFFNHYNKKDFEQNVLKHKDLYKDCFDNFSEEYLHDICVSDSDLVQFGSYFRMPDCESKAMNFKNGIRKTTDQIEDAETNIFIFGHSTIMGYYNYDDETIASCLQRLVGKHKINVYNHSSINEVPLNVYNRILQTDISQNDIVIVGVPKRCVENISLFPHIDLTEYFYEHTEKENLFDRAHLTAYANRWIADVIYEKIKIYFPKIDIRETEILENANVIVKTALDYLPPIEDSKRVGAIVMSANPFTKGHRHICEVGSKIFDHFVVFLMQSGLNLLFEKDDNVKLARLSLEDLENVTVIELPNVISFQRFYPEYNDIALRVNKNYIGADAYKFVTIIGKALQGLNIGNCMFGIETEDQVTRQIVEQAQVLGPRMKINIICIPRKTLNNGQKVISGTMCRELIKEKKFDELNGVLMPKAINYIRTHNLKLQKQIIPNNHILTIQEKKVKDIIKFRLENLNLLIVEESDFDLNINALLKIIQGYTKKDLLEIIEKRISASVWAGYLYLMKYDMDEEMYQKVMELMKDPFYKEKLRAKHDGTN